MCGMYIWYGEEGTGRGHPSTASVPITVLLYNGPLLCGFNVAIKRLQTNNLTSLKTIRRQLIYFSRLPTGGVYRM